MKPIMENNRRFLFQNGGDEYGIFGKCSALR